MDCTPDIEARKRASQPGGANTSRTNHVRNQHGATMQELRDAMNRQQSLDETANAGATATQPVYTEPTPGEQASLRALSRAASDPRGEMFKNMGVQGVKERFERWQEANTMMNGTSSQTATFWTNMQNRVGKWFEHAGHDLVHWGNTVANMKGRLAYQNEFVQAITGMIPKIRGIQNGFMQRHHAILKDLQPIAERTGHKAEVLFDQSGHYLNYLHAPERNAHLLDLWNRKVEKFQWELNELPKERARLNAELATATDKTTKKALKAQLKALGPERSKKEIEFDIGNFQRKITDLEENLENPNPPEGLVSGSYTNAQARMLAERMEQTSGMTRAELEYFAKRISGEFDHITKELARRGLIPPEQLAAIPDFKWYAPVMSKDRNVNGLANDTSYYIANSRYQMEGTTGEVDSATNSLGFFAHRAATEIGMEDFGSMLYGLFRKRGNEIGLRIDNKFDGENAGKGIVVTVPMKNEETGAITLERRHLYFKDNYQLPGSNVTGANLNEALNSNAKLGNAFVEFMRTGTSLYGQSFTRFQPGFAIVGGFRDFMERGIHMVNRAYYNDAGQRIEGTSLVKQFYLNSRRAGDMLRQALYGKNIEGTEAQRLFREFQEEGLFQKYLPDKNQRPLTAEQLARQYGRQSQWLRNEGLGSWADALDKHQFKEFNRGLQYLRGKGQRVLFELDRWNDWLQNSAAFSHYITLREQGFSPRRAGAYVRDMMDMTKAGTITDYLSVISPFMRPTMQGAKAIATTFGLNARTPREIFKEGKKGWIATASAGLAFSVLYPLMRESLGKDDAGQYRMDTMRPSQLTSSFAIGYGDEGEYFKMPMGFGPIRIAATLGLVMDRMYRDMMTPSEAAFELMFSAGRDLVPSNTPGFDFKENPAAYITRMVAPAGLMPFIELGTNTNNFGGKVYNDYDPNKAASEQGRKSTPAIWHQVANYIHKQTGMDLAPEQYMHFIQSLTHGPLRLITSSITDTAKRESPHLYWEEPTAYGPLPQWLRVMGTSLFFGKARNTEQTGYYTLKKDIMGEVKRLGLSLGQDNKKGEEGADIVRQRLLAAGMEPERVETAILLKEAEKKLRGLGSSFSKEWGRWYEKTEDSESLKQAFLDFEEAQNAIFIDLLQQVQAL